MSKKKIKTIPTSVETTTVVKDENQLKSFIIIIGIMLITFVSFYYLTVWIKYEKKRYTPVEENVEIKYDKILLGNMLDYKGEYFVLAVDGNDEEYVSRISTELGIDIGKILDKTYYTASMNDKMNSNYVGEQSNLMVSSVKDLKVSKTTLFHVNNKKIVKAYEGNDAIFEYLHSNVKVVK